MRSPSIREQTPPSVQRRLASTSQRRAEGSVGQKEEGRGEPMRSDIAILETYKLLDALNLRDWKVRVIERFTAPQLADLHGYCDAIYKTIWYTERGIANDTEAQTLIAHEVAHCLQPIVQFRDAEKAH